MTAGYSGTPLPRKLGLEGRKNILFDQAPAGVLRELGIKSVPRASKNEAVDFGIVFTKSQTELKEKFRELVPRLDPATSFWIAWPKKSSGVATDLNENIIRELGLAAGMVDVKVCAIDETWSGLKFVFRLKDRPKQAAKRGR
jgi:hypothetical protein